MLLRHAKVDFKDIKFTLESFPIFQAKKKLEFNQWPAVKINDKFYVQSGAIMHKLGLKYGYYNFFDPMQTYNMNVISQAVTDLWDEFATIMFTPITE